MPAGVLVVEDDADMRQLLRTFLRQIGCGVRDTAFGRRAVDLFTEGRPALVLLDINLPDIDGLQVLRQLKEIDATCPVVIMSSYSGAHVVTEAMRLGAAKYLTKPTPLPELRVLIDQLLEEVPADLPATSLELEGVIGASEAMQVVFRMVRRVARTRATVLIRGESGTGKEVVARAIHRLGSPADSEFVSVDCTNIPGTLMETELFGHVSGAFTDAKSQKVGLLEMADGGTLFLDEIGLMPLELQAKLLNILETQRFRRVGGIEQIQVAVRFLAATNEDLEVAVKQGRFREDLYYRLNVVPIDLPPLRERGEDVLLLAEQFLEVYTTRHGTAARTLGDDVIALFRSYSWPGNVRELKNAIERTVLMTDRPVIRADDLLAGRRSQNGFGGGGEWLKIEANGKISVDLPPQGLPLSAVEREVIRAALERTGGNITRAASLLDVSRDTLRYRMVKYELK